MSLKFPRFLEVLTVKLLILFFTILMFGHENWFKNVRFMGFSGYLKIFKNKRRYLLPEMGGKSKKVKK